MKHILIPTDFSENARNAVNYAISFFQDTAATFYLLHVSLAEDVNEEKYYYKLSENLGKEKIFYNPIKNLEEELKRAEAISSNTNHRFIVIHEYVDFIESIRHHVNEKAIDYIIMGTKGASENNGDMIGTNTGNVITKVKCSILVIPKKATYHPLRTVVFPTDFNIFYKNRILNTITEILKVKNTSLSILYISKRVKELTSLQQKNRDFLQEHLEDKSHEIFFITDESMEKAVDSFVQKNKADLIAMVAKNLNFFQRLLFKPTAEKISYHTKIPFLVLHE
jgi:nucleotide-binding universal stress UspA family protein